MATLLATYWVAACLPGLAWETDLLHLVALAHPVAYAAAAVVIDDTAGHIRIPASHWKARVAVAAAFAARSCRGGILPADLGPSRRLGCSIRRPIVHTDRAGHSRSHRTVGHVGRRSPRGVSSAAGHLVRGIAAVAVAADTRRIAAVVVAEGRPLAQTSADRRASSRPTGRSQVPSVAPGSNIHKAPSSSTGMRTRLDQRCAEGRELANIRSKRAIVRSYTEVARGGECGSRGGEARWMRTATGPPARQG